MIARGPAENNVRFRAREKLDYMISERAYFSPRKIYEPSKPVEFVLHPSANFYVAKK